jgi:hypothetical protein
VNQFVLSGTTTLVPSGTELSCYRGPESDLSPCSLALSSSNQKSFGFLLTDRAIRAAGDNYPQPSPGFLAAYNAGPARYESISPAVHCQLRPRPICRSLCQSSAMTLQLPARSRVFGHRRERSLLCGLIAQRPPQGCSPVMCRSARRFRLRRRRWTADVADYRTAGRSGVA